MKVEPSALSFAAKKIVLEESKYESDLPSEEEAINAARNPAGTKWLGNELNPELASTLQGNAVSLAQASYAIALNLGLAGSSSLGGIDSLVELVGQAAFSNDVDIRALALMGTDSAIDMIVDGPLAAVPFVGSAAKAVWSMVQVIYSATRVPEVALPPMFRLNPAEDDNDTRSAIARVKGRHKSDDWTPLFLPRQTGLWKMKVVDGGMEFSRGDRAELYDDDIFALGCAPGDLFYVDAGAQSRVTTGNVTIPSNSSDPKHSNVLSTGDNPFALHNLVFGLGEWYPSLSALGRSVWSVLGTRNAAMFQVDAAQVAKEWAKFATATAYFRADMDKQLGARITISGKTQKRVQIAGYLGNVGAAMHTLRARDAKGNLRRLTQDELLAAALDPGKRAGADTVGKQAVMHANHLARRQRQAAQTSINALVSKNAPALRKNKELRDFFMSQRTKLLDAGKFDGLSLDEVPDEQLRKRIVNRSRPPGGDMPTAFVDPVSAERQRQHQKEMRANLQKIDRPLGFGGYGAERDPDDETGGGYGLAIAGLAVTAGLAAGGIALARRRR